MLKPVIVGPHPDQSSFQPISTDLHAASSYTSVSLILRLIEKHVSMNASLCMCSRFHSGLIFFFPPTWWFMWSIYINIIDCCPDLLLFFFLLWAARHVNHCVTELCCQRSAKSTITAQEWRWDSIIQAQAKYYNYITLSYFCNNCNICNKCTFLVLGECENVRCSDTFSYSLNKECDSKINKHTEQRIADPGSCVCKYLHLSGLCQAHVGASTTLMAADMRASLVFLCRIFLLFPCLCVCT